MQVCGYCNMTPLEPLELEPCGHVIERAAQQLLRLDGSVCPVCKISTTNTKYIALSSEQLQRLVTQIHGNTNIEDALLARQSMIERIVKKRIKNMVNYTLLPQQQAIQRGLQIVVFVFSLYIFYNILELLIEKSPLSKNIFKQ